MGTSDRIGLALVATVGKRYTEAPVERLPDTAALRDWLAACAMSAGLGCCQ